MECNNNLSMGKFLSLQYNFITVFTLFKFYGTVKLHQTKITFVYFTSVGLVRTKPFCSFTKLTLKQIFIFEISGSLLLLVFLNRFLKGNALVN